MTIHLDRAPYVDPAALTVGEYTIPRSVATQAIGTGSGLTRLTYFTAQKTETASSVTAVCTTAASGTTSARLGLYEVAANGDLTLIASTANDTTLFSAGGTTYARAFTVPAVKVAGARYAVGWFWAGTSQAILRGTYPAAPSSAPRLAGIRDVLADLPASITAADSLATDAVFYHEILP